jgi:tetraacyldisaccharide-1-P 4'-kinase
MTQDEIIEMADKAEFVSHGKPSDEESELFVCTDKDIVRFAKLVAEKEREACAKVCETMARRTNDIRTAALEMAVENIMARGQA